jgi:hypothetical protein
LSFEKVAVVLQIVIKKKNKLLGFWSASKLYQLSGHRLLAKLVPTFAGKGVSHGQRNRSPWLLTSLF